MKVKLDDEEYNIKEIINEIKIKKTLYYLIKWLKYDELKNSWKSKINLSEITLK